ncbi:hypothetical protein GA0115243_109933 [Streptomyces sp. ScaeMP-e83]|nr:hypothetical protein GA0115243_109933 [Streptomyces sp. ScaeMP-e83]
MTGTDTSGPLRFAGGRTMFTTDNRAGQSDILAL